MSTKKIVDEKEKEKNLKLFNRAVIDFIDALLDPVSKSSLKGKLYAKEFRSEFTRAVRESPNLIKIEFGPAVADCRKPTNDKDEKYFLTVQYAKKMTEFSARYQVPFEKTIQAIEMVKKVFSAENAENKQKYFMLLSKVIELYDKL